MSDKTSNTTERSPEPTMDDFWSFRTMLTPLLVQVIFWIASLGCIVMGIFQIAQARPDGVLDQMQLLRGVAWMIFGPLAVRLACEAVILFFRINETLTEIKNKLK